MARILNSDKKYRLTLIFVIVVFIFIVLLAVFLSKINFKPNSLGTVATIVNDGDLIINYTDGDKISFSDKKEHEYKVSITNSSEEKIYYSVYLENVNKSSVHMEIRNEQNEVIKKINNNSNNEKLINLNKINGKETIRYTIIISSNDYTNFKADLKVKNESINTKSFADLILLNNNVNEPKTKIGKETATTDEGLISTKDNKGITYYYRGNVRNNYVKIGEYLFRIVRINGDNTVRIVLEDVLSTQFIYNSNDITPETDITSFALLNNSTIINDLNNWLNSNLNEYIEYFTNGDYCLENNFSYILNNIKYSKTYERAFINMEPSLVCDGNIYTGKIGMLSIDEVIFAGGNKSIANDKYYLYNKNIAGNYLTNSAYFINTSNVVAMFNVMSNGAIGDGILVNNLSYVRPVINISNEAKVKGEGTINDPYIIVS